MLKTEKVQSKIVPNDILKIVSNFRMDVVYYGVFVPFMTAGVAGLADTISPTKKINEKNKWLGTGSAIIQLGIVAVCCQYLTKTPNRDYNPWLDWASMSLAYTLSGNAVSVIKENAKLVLDMFELE